MAQIKTISLSSETVIKDRYSIKKLLENSGLTMTYLAYDTFREKKVIIKELCPEKLVERIDGRLACKKLFDETVFEEMKEYMIGQAKKLIRLYPLNGIANIISYIEENGTVYIISEYIEGLPLEAFLYKKKAEKLLVDSLVVFFTPFLDTLERLHEAGVIHGKIRPDQIIVTKKNGAVLTGFCEPVAALVRPVFMDEVVLARNSHYAPVELFMDQSEIKQSVDVYGVASTMYHCVTGIIPPHFYERIQNTVSLQSPWDMGIDISSGQSKAIMKAMTSYTFERTQTIAQLRTGLVQEKESKKTPVPIVLYHTPFVFHKIDIYKNRKKMLIAAIVCCLLLFAVPKTVSVTKEMRINQFYHKFSVASLYEQCTMLRGMAAGKRAVYANDYTRLTEGDKFNKIKYYDLNTKQYFLRSEVDFSEKNYSYLTIDYRDSAKAVVSFHKAGETIMYDINLLREDGSFFVRKAIIKDGSIKKQEDLTVKP